jgi:hypothetical protein
VQDADRDTIRCRWAEVTEGECSGVCDAFPDAVLDVVCMYVIICTGQYDIVTVNAVEIHTSCS